MSLDKLFIKGVVSMVILTIGFGYISGDDDSQISHEFKNSYLRAIHIIEEMISQKRLYTDEEREYVNTFSDKEFTPNEENIKDRVMKLQRHYFAKINHKNLDDPKNDILINNLLAQMNEIKKELNW